MPPLPGSLSFFMVNSYWGKKNQSSERARILPPPAPLGSGLGVPEEGLRVAPKQWRG